MAVRYRLNLFLLFISFTGCSLNTDISLNLSSSDSQSSVTCDTSISNNYGGGDGSASHPFTLCSLDHWTFFANDSSSWGLNFKLYADLDFTGVTAANFKSIGSAVTPFTGTFNGNNFKIHNLNITESGNTLALFKNTDSNVNISNLTLEDITFTDDVRLSGLVLDHGNGGTLTLDNITLKNLQLSPTAKLDNGGGLIGISSGPIDISNININNIYFTNPGSGPSNYWGGLVGAAQDTLNISNVSGGSITTDGSSYAYVGGLVGLAVKAATFSNVNLTNLDITAGMSSASGLIAKSRADITISQTHLSGSINDGSFASGLIAQSDNSGITANITITDSSFDGSILSSFNAGGLITLVLNNNISIQRSYYKGDMLNIWNGVAGGLVEQAQGISNTISISDSYVISNMSNLHATNWLIAGIVGTAQGTVNISKVYYAGSLNGTAPRACFADSASASSFTATDSYYDSTVCTANANKTGSITGVTGISTASLQTATPFTNWSASTWTFTASMYPKLSWEP